MYLDDMRNDGAPDQRVLKNSIHVSRSPRLCECGEPIAAGESYNSVAMIEDGKFTRLVYCHPVCRRAQAMMAGSE